VNEEALAHRGAVAPNKKKHPNSYLAQFVPTAPRDFNNIKRGKNAYKVLIKEREGKPYKIEVHIGGKF